MLGLYCQPGINHPTVCGLKVPEVVINYTQNHVLGAHEVQTCSKTHIHLDMLRLPCQTRIPHDKSFLKLAAPIDEPGDTRGLLIQYSSWATLG